MALYSKATIENLIKVKHLKPEQVTDLVYTTPEGEDKTIVLAGQKGQPAKQKRHKRHWWPEEKKVEAATIHAACGNTMRTSELTKIPVETIRAWKEEEWWMVLQSRIRRENGEVMDKKLSTIIEKALDKIEDAVVDGNYQYDVKRGTLHRVPINARDLAIVTNAAFDKRQLLRGEATKIVKAVNTEEHLDKLAEKFIEAVKKKGVGVKQVEVVDVEYSEVSSKEQEIGDGQMGTAK